jgi:hypothetical protein
VCASKPIEKYKEIEQNVRQTLKGLAKDTLTEKVMKGIS